MIYVVILAAGKGERLKSATLPKQFLKIGTRTVLEQAVEKFTLSPQVKKIIVVVNQQWMSHAKEIFRNSSYADMIEVCQGGNDRQQSLFLGCKFIQSLHGSKEEPIIISHDAARPFISRRIINDNIEAFKDRKIRVVDTVIPATDTIIRSVNKLTITSIPNRDELYMGQTPQSFYLQDYLDAYSEHKEEEGITDAANLLLKSGKEVALVEGDPFNIKITTDYDLSFAQFLLKKD